MEECLEVDLGEWPSKSESDRYRNDSLLGKFEITNALLRLIEEPEGKGPLPSGVRPSGVRPGDAPSYLEEKKIEYQEPDTVKYSEIILRSNFRWLNSRIGYYLLELNHLEFYLGMHHIHVKSNHTFKCLDDYITKKLRYRDLMYFILKLLA